MEAPRIQYAKTEDGVSIAYRAFGRGPILFIPPNLFASHHQMDWEVQTKRSVLERLATRATVVTYDPRGVGMSQRDKVDFSRQSLLADLAAVVDNACPRPFGILRFPETGMSPATFVSAYPDRVSHLTFWVREDA